MTDYDTQKDILEMAEVLTAEFENRLEVETYNDTTGRQTKVVFEFNEDKELTNIFVED